MEKIRISVKGDADQSAEALANRGLSGVFIDEANGRSFWDVPESVRTALVVWYYEPAVCTEENNGFPVGTLLHHS